MVGAVEATWISSLAIVSGVGALTSERCAHEGLLQLEDRCIKRPKKLRNGDGLGNSGLSFGKRQAKR